MSRVFAEDEMRERGGGHGTGSRVYVNNMNTTHATVSLPARTPQTLRERNSEAPGAAAHNFSSSHADSISGGGGGAGGGGGGSVARDSLNGQTTGLAAQERRSESPPLLPGGERLHPNLNDVYNRIMRRLQRQMNYAEYSRVSLAEQYGVDVQLACEEDEREAADTTRRMSAKRRSRASPSTASLVKHPPDGEDAEHIPLVKASRAASRPFADYAAPASGRGSVSGRDRSPLSPRGAGGTAPPSRLLQFKQTERARPRASSVATVGNDNADAVAGHPHRPVSASDRYLDLERELSDQPCPRPLRLVIQHVLNTLQKKMTLAEGGSLKDCIVYAFECRALLDRLLKEIPLYTQYSAAQGSAGSKAQQELATVFQQLRRKPVLLPRGGYTEDPTTGAIRGHLVGEYSGSEELDYASPTPPSMANSGGALGGLSPSNTLLLPTLPGMPRENVTSKQSTPPPTFMGSDMDSAVDVPLPASYGKSARLMGGGAAAGGAAAPGRRVTGGAPVPASLAPIGAPPPQSPPQRRPILRDHMRGSGGGGAGAAADAAGVGGTPVNGGRPPSSSEPTVAPRLLSPSIDAEVLRGATSGKLSGPAATFAAAHRATRLVSVGTMTDENGATMVSLAEHDARKRDLDALTVRLADTEMRRTALAEQLCEEGAYVDQKRQVVQYLRETLVRECTMLRAQLHLATSRVQQLQQQQHNLQSSLRAAAGGGAAVPVASSGLYDAHDANNASVTIGGNATRTHKHSAANSTSMTHQSPRQSAQRLSYSGTSLVSAAGGASASPTGHGNRSVSRLHRQQSSGFSPGASMSAAPPGMHNVSGGASPAAAGGGLVGASISSAPVGQVGSVALASSTDVQTLSELEAVQSLLDLVLLAVEEDAVVPRHTLQMVRGGDVDADVVKDGFRKDPKQQMDEMRNEYDERHNALKKSILARTAEQNFIVVQQRQEIERLRALTDTTRVRFILLQRVMSLRSGLQQLRTDVAEQLHFFKAILQNTSQSLLRRAALVDKTLSENLVLSGTVSAMRDMVESASSLLMPMLTHEYRCGYHPWPLKLRNTTDPLAHVIHLRYGAAEVIRLRDSLNIFGQLYGTLHRYIIQQLVQPDAARPQAGRPLQHLCAALALNPMSHTDVIFGARHAYDAEVQLRRRLARLNARLTWNAYLQRIFTDRSVAALVEAGLNPRLASLPVAGRINLLAHERANLLQARVAVQRERAENAKTAYRLWREKEIDILEGYPALQTQRNRLALLTGGTAQTTGTMSAVTLAGRGMVSTAGLGGNGAEPRRFMPESRIAKAFNRAAVLPSEGEAAVSM